MYGSLVDHKISPFAGRWTWFRKTALPQLPVVWTAHCVFLLSVLLGWSAFPAAAATTAGPLAQDEIWSGTLEVTGNVTVPRGISLTVTAGTVVRFAQGTGLVVQGSLRSEGTGEVPVVFTSASANPSPGSWTGIVFEVSSGETGFVAHTVIEHAEKGVVSSGASPVLQSCTLQRNITGVYLSQSGTSITVSGCIITENRDYGICGFTPGVGQPRIEHNHIARCRNGIFLSGGYGYSDPVVRYNLVHDHTEVGVHIDYTHTVDVSFNTIVGNDRGIELSNIQWTSSVSSNIVTRNTLGISFFSYWTGCELGYNDLWANDADYSGLSAGEGDMASDPLFAGIQDFHLQPASPCVNAGDPTFLDTDGTRSDMGAYGAEGNPPAESGDRPPETPVHVSPAEGALLIPASGILESSPFLDPDPEDAHAASRWQLRKSSGTYATPAHDSGETSAWLTHCLIPHSTLEPESTYFWRVRYQDSRNGWSAWSRETSFTTPGDSDPPQTLITGGPNDGAVITSGSFYVYWGAQDDYRGPFHFSWALDSTTSWSPYSADTSCYFSSLPDGPHTLYVRARDPSGNEDPTPASRTFTVDTTTPVISNVRTSQITHSSAVVSWETNEPATSQARYGLGTAYGNATPLDSQLLFSHSVTLENLDYNTLYHYAVESRDAAGHWTSSQDFTLRTITAQDKSPPETSFSEGPPEGSLIRTRDVVFRYRGQDDITPQASLTFATLLDDGSWSSFSSATSRSLTNLPDGAHTFQVTARDQSGKTDPTPAVRTFSVDATPPAPPSQLTAQASSSGADLQWSASPSPDLQAYNLYWDGGTGTIDYRMPYAVLAPSPSSANLVIQSRGIYTFALRAVDQAGNEEQNTHVVATLRLTRPDAPTLQPVVSPTTSRLQVLSGGKEAGTSLWLNGSAVAAPDDATTWSHAVTLTPGLNRFELTCRNGLGEESPPTVVVIDCDPLPLAVSSLQADGEGSGTTVALSWAGYDEAGQKDIVSYRVYAAHQSFSDVSGMGPAATGPAGTFTHTVRGLERNSPCYLAVAAVDAKGQINPIVTPVCAIPTDIEPPEGVSALRVQCFRDRLAFAWNPSANTAQDLAGYRLTFNGLDSGLLAPAQTGFEQNGLSPATLYTVSVKAVDTSGNESPGATLSAATLVENPSGLALEPGNGKVSLTWIDSQPRNLVSEYRVYDSPSPFTHVGGMTPRTRTNGTSAGVAGLTNNVPHYFAVTAVNISGGEEKEVTARSATPQGDREGPTVSDLRFENTTLSAGAVLKTAGTFSVTASDPSGMSRVEFLLDSTLRHTDTNGSSRYTYSWNILSDEDGSHVLTVKAFDTLGNTTTVSLAIEVAANPPRAPTITAPATGTLTNKIAVTVSGKAETGTEVLLYDNDLFVGSGVVVDAAGNFSSTLSLVQGENRIQAAARHRGGTSPKSSTVLVTLDSTLPPSPQNLTAQCVSGGKIRLTWRAPQDASIRGYNLYRASAPFESPAGGLKINSALISGTLLDHLPPADGLYCFRASAVDAAGNESELSNTAEITLDTTPPRATSIRYTPSGPFDSVSGRMGRGLVGMQLSVSEPLMAVPFLSITPGGGVPIAVELQKASETEYTGTFSITDSTPSGTAYAVFSGRDLTGNRGTEIDSGATIPIDAGGPTVTQIVIDPREPVKNDLNHPVSVTATFGLDEPVEPGTLPELSFVLSGRGRAATPLIAVERTETLSGQAETWKTTFALPADAGLFEVENLEFHFKASDDLGNSGSRIVCRNRFQVYQGDLPPLAPPQGLKGESLPGGRVKLSWAAVPEAADYEIHRKGAGEEPFSLLARSGRALELVDTPPADGAYAYAAASVRRENDQEAVSGLSAPVVVESDSIAPGPPQDLTLELMSRGINALWKPPSDAGEPVTYSLYRADTTELPDTTGLSPIIRGIQETTVLDPKPSANEHCYAVTAVDRAGNESAPSNFFYLNFGLLPVSSLKVVQRGGERPIISWTPPSSHGVGTIAGYHLYLGAAGGRVRLSPEILAQTSFTDTGFAEDERHYTVTAVDDHGVESLGREISLPPLSAVLKEGETLRRGIMNRLEFNVSSRASARVDSIRLKVEAGGHSGLSEAFALDPGESRVIPVSFGGYADLTDTSPIVTTLSIAAHEGELAQIVREEDVEVEDGMLVSRIENEPFTRGATGRARFVLENTGEEEVEIVTATGSGGAPSREISLALKDPDGNVLSVTPYHQSLGAKVVTLANGNTVARIGPGETFGSEPVELAVPLSAPDRVSVHLAIQNIHFHQGRPEQVTMQGLSTRHEVTLVDTSYWGSVTSVSPEVSNGDREIVIRGRAAERGSELPVAQAPLKLVIAVSGFERSSQVVTDGQGEFTYVFNPLPQECGQYTVFAVHPEVLDKPRQASFVINRVSVSPQTLSLTLPRNYEKTVSLEVATGEGTAVQNVHLACEPQDQPEGALAPGVHVSLGSPVAALGSKQKGRLDFTLWGDNASEPAARIVFKVRSEESTQKPWATVSVNLQFTDSKPVLCFSPDHLETGVSFSGGATESVSLENRGLADLNDVSLSVVSPDGAPAPSWVQLNSDPFLGTIPVGEKRPVALSFAPTAHDTAEGLFTFYLRVISSNYRRTDIPVFVTVTQSGVGNALFKVSDIYTGTVNARGQIVQGLQGATLTLQNEAVPTIQRTQTSDSLGEVLVRDLPAGRYRYRITASNHQEDTGRLWIKPGITASEPVFLACNLVTVEWRVVETTIQDRYEIVLKATFETNVPAPVVVAEPASIHLPDMSAGDVYQGEFTLSNYGLVRADHVQFSLPSGGDAFRYELLSPVPEQLGAKERLTIPFRVTCLRSFNPSNDGNSSGGGCSRNVQWGRLTYDYLCANGQKTSNSYPYCLIYDTGECAGTPAAPGAPTGPGGATTWTYTYTGPSGTVGPVPAPAPKPIEGIKCWPKPARIEELTGSREACQLETVQNVVEEVGSSVNCVLREYNDEAADLSVKVPGGNVSVLRYYYGNEWHFEDMRHNLKFIYGPLGQDIRSIDKGGVVYERAAGTSSSIVFTHRTFKITAAGSNYRWENKHGNWRSFDANGRLTTYGTSNGVLTQLIYEPGEEARLSGLADRNGRQVIWFEYSSGGALSAVRDLDGRRVEYSYTGGKLTSVKDVLGNTTSYNFDASGRMVKKTDPLGRSETMAYDRYGNITQVLDSTNQGYHFQYDYDEGKSEYYVQIKTPGGMVKEIWYDRQGDTKRVDVNGKTIRKITKDGRNLLITDESGGTTRKELDEWSNLTKIVYPDGATVRYEYAHALNRPVRVTNELGTVTQYAYDTAGNLIEKVEAAGTISERVTRFAHDTYGNVTSVKGVGDSHTSEAVALMEYDLTGNLVSIQEPEGATTRFTHDSMGNVLTRTNDDGKVFTLAYDAAGRLVSAANPLGHTTQWFYDAAGNRTHEIDPEGRTRTYHYDIHDRLIQWVDAAGNATVVDYNADGRPTRRIDAEGKILAYEYDSRGRLVKAIDGNGNVVGFEYADTIGCASCLGDFDKPARIIYPTFAREFDYDIRGRKIFERDVLSSTESTLTQFAYDAAGNLTQIIDKELRKTTYRYDFLGRLVMVTDPQGNISSYDYNDRDALVALTDANGNTLRFEHDRNNRLAKEIRPMGQVTAYEYNALSQLVRQTDPEGQRAAYTYDDAGRVSEVRMYWAHDYLLPAKTVLFNYDRVGNLIGYEDGVTSAHYSYDDAYRKVGEVVDYGAFELASTSSWYGNGAKKSFTGPDGITYHYTYDLNNQLSSIEIPDKGFITYNTHTWFRPTMMTLPGGTTRELSYDPLMRLQKLDVRDPAGNVLLSHDYVYDRMDNLLRKRTEHGEYRYTYDELYRLIRGSRPNRQDEEFTYDKVGNRLTADAVQGVWSYNHNSELESFGNRTFSYDANGNTAETVSGNEVVKYFHNLQDQLERVETGEGRVLAEYGYDPFGRRLWKDVEGQKTYFFYAEEGLIGEYDATGKAIKTYGFKPGSTWSTDPLFMKQDSEYYFYQNDHLGTPMLMTTTNGGVVWSARYTLFGEAEVDPLSSSVTSNLRAGGQYYDAETGLHYNYHRTYHPGLGRYLETDPLLAGSNPYAYVLDPTNAIDPLGLFRISWSRVGIGILKAGTAVAVGALVVAALPAAVVAAVPCAVVTGAAILGSAALGWCTGQVITGERVEFSLSDWQLHVRKMCDDERSEMLGEVLVGWGTFGAGSTKDLKFCFAAGTPVWTEGGSVVIEDLQVGDRVLSRDEKTGEMSYQEVSQVFVTPGQPLYELRVTNGVGDSETFHATGDHPFYIRGHGWTRASDLLPGDEIFTSLGGWLRVSGGTWTDRRAAVYNIEVNSTHTYFVGQLQVWVHNNCGGEKSTTKWGPEHGRGNIKHNNAIEDELNWAEAEGATDLMKNKRQYDLSGNKVSTSDGRRVNPDAAYTMENTRHNTNFVSNHQLDDVSQLNRELENWKRMQAADPSAINSLIFKY